jgi:type I restriction enzyme M protein
MPARCPSSELREAEDYNCNIRRYVDNAPPPEPHDVRAHLHGGVPRGNRQPGPLLAQLQRPARTPVRARARCDYMDFAPRSPTSARLPA